MRLKKKRNYYAYGSYTKKRRLRMDRVLLVLGAVVLVVGLVVALNYNRIRLLAKGYSFSSTSQILKLTKSQQKEILANDKLDHIKDWISVSHNVSYYDEYEKYYALYPDLSLNEVTEFIDTSYDTYASTLNNLGYDNEKLWSVVKMATLDDLQYLTTHKITYDRISPFQNLKGFKFTHMLDYEEAYRQYNNYNYALNIVNYPFIISTHSTNDVYTIANKENIDILVKKGFYLPSDYEPSDLVDPNDYGLPVSPNSNGYMVRQEAAQALKEMFDDAKKAGYVLVINSAYRSYVKQKETYESFEKLYGGQYAAEYVALPGASEHQTGLGIDLTSQSVLSGTYNVFGDSTDYLWVVSNCYKYGFIMRFEDDKADITGIAHEPWHVRYVGKDVAKKIHDEGWTFEEYCLYEGNIPDFES